MFMQRFISSWCVLPLRQPNVVGAARDRYWWVGLNDLKQESHTLKRNFPVLANIR